MQLQDAVVERSVCARVCVVFGQEMSMTFGGLGPWRSDMSPFSDVMPQHSAPTGHGVLFSEIPFFH